MSPSPFSERILSEIGVGIVVLDASARILLWNGFMEKHSGMPAESVIGKTLYECFDYIPVPWVNMKLRSVLMLKNFSFTSWKQRPYVFKFPHHRPITGASEHMFQDCVFLPLTGENGEPCICMEIHDVTDVAIFQRQVEQLTEVNATLERLSLTDALTGVFNRRYLLSHLESVFAEAKRYARPFTAVLVDLDHFKQVNDTHGHLAGDEVLRVMARRLSQSLRSADVLGRYGGEEFLVILPETPVDAAAILGERLRHTVQVLPVHFGEAAIRVTASFGMAGFHPDQKDAHSLLEQADLALYRSKELGRNRVTQFEPAGWASGGPGG